MKVTPVLLLVWLLAAGAGSAHADGQEDAFRLHQARSAALYKAKQYSAAIRELHQAYAIKQLPRLLFNLGQAHRRLGHSSEATRYWEMYLKANVDISPAERAEIEGMIRTTRDLASGAVPTEEQPPAEATRPPADREGNSTAEHAGPTDTTERETSQPPVPAIPPAAAQRPPVHLDPPSVRQLAPSHAAPRGSSLAVGRVFWPGVTLSALGLAGLGVAGWLYADLRGDNQSFATATDEVTKRDARDRAAVLSPAALSGFIVGGGLLAGGSALILLGIREGHRPHPLSRLAPQASLVPMRGGSAVVVSGSF